MSGSGIKRGPAVFGDLRGWIDALRDGNELEEITGEVDWDVELGNIIRMMQGSGDGPAFLFNNIKDYNGPDALCSRMFTGGHASYSRIAMMFGLAPDTPARELVRICRTIFQERIEPRNVNDGPVKENIIMGDDIDLLKFPIPKWNKLDGGRYALTYAGCVTRDPDSGIHNVGIYRGMVGGPAEIPVLLGRAQHWGGHFSKHQQSGE
ncbi:unnamed protein product, partial [Laminaria digitata]